MIVGHELVQIGNGPLSHILLAVRQILAPYLYSTVCMCVACVCWLIFIQLCECVLHVYAGLSLSTVYVCCGEYFCCCMCVLACCMRACAFYVSATPRTFVRQILAPYLYLNNCMCELDRCMCLRYASVYVRLARCHTFCSVCSILGFFEKTCV